MFDAIVVLYNKEIPCIASIASLMESELVESVIVCDNSTSQEIHAHNGHCKCEKLVYLDMQGNQGLSAAYNKAIGIARAKYVVIFDDDTMVPPDYLDKARAHVCRSPDVDIFLPIVKTKNMTLSPCKKGVFRFTEIRDLDNMPARISAINSGMVIKRSLFDSISYREELFLDMVDNAFMDDAKRVGAHVEVMRDTRLFQDYSGDNDDLDAAVTRYKISKRDNKVYYSHIPFGKLFYAALVVHWKVKLAVRFRRPSLLFI